MNPHTEASNKTPASGPEFETDDGIKYIQRSTRQWIQECRLTPKVYREATTYVDPQTLEIREQPAILDTDKRLLEHLYLQPDSKAITQFYLQSRAEEEEADLSKLDLVSYYDILAKPRNLMSPEELAVTGPEFRRLYDYLWLDHKIILQKVDYHELSIKALRSMYIAHKAGFIRGIGQYLLEECSPLRISISRPNYEDKSWFTKMYDYDFDHNVFSIEELTMPGSIANWWHPDKEPTYFHYSPRHFIHYHDINPESVLPALKVMMFTNEHWKGVMIRLRCLYDLLCRSANEHHRSNSDREELERLDYENAELRTEVITEAWVHVFRCVHGTYFDAYKEVEQQMFKDYPKEDQRKLMTTEFLERIKAIVDSKLNEAVPQWMAFKFD